MKKHSTDLPEVYLLELPKFEDDRGFFVESYNRATLADLGINTIFVQDNHSLSNANVIRGMHFQSAPGQAKLVRCIRGQVFDVVVDINPNSPTFKKWVGVVLSPERNNAIYIPETGYAHGFAVIAGPAEVQYKCSSFYNPATEKTLRYNDPEVGITWMMDKNKIILSERDKAGLPLEEVCKLF